MAGWQQCTAENKRVSKVRTRQKGRKKYVRTEEIWETLNCIRAQASRRRNRQRTGRIREEEIKNGVGICMFLSTAEKRFCRAKNGQSISEVVGVGGKLTRGRKPARGSGQCSPGRVAEVLLRWCLAADDEQRAARSLCPEVESGSYRLRSRFAEDSKTATAVQPPPCRRDLETRTGGAGAFGCG